MELDPSRTAVIAVHLQNDIVTADGAFGGFFAAQAVERDVIGVTATLLDAARRVRRHRRLHPRRLATRPTRPGRQLPHPGRSSKQSGAWSRAATRRRSSRSSPRRTATSSSPTSGSAGSPPASWTSSCARRGVDTVLFTGVATNVSVEGTARQASDLGYRTIIVADACSAADPATHDASIASLGLLAEITTTAEAVEALSGVAVSA